VLSEKEEEEKKKNIMVNSAELTGTTTSDVIYEVLHKPM